MGMRVRIQSKNIEDVLVGDETGSAITTTSSSPMMSGASIGGLSINKKGVLAFIAQHPWIVAVGGGYVMWKFGQTLQELALIGGAAALVALYLRSKRQAS